MPPAPTDPSPLPAATAHLGWRLLALVYDLLPLAALWFATAAAAYAVNGLAPVAPGSAAALVLFAALLGVSFLYFGLSWRRGGQTIGMRAWRLELVDARGGRPGWAALGVRAAVGVLSLAALGTGFLWALLDRERRSWHDIASGTRVVRRSALRGGGGNTARKR